MVYTFEPWQVAAVVLILITVFAAYSVITGLGMKRGLGQASSLEVAVGRDAIQGQILLLAATLLVVTLVAAFYLFYRKPTANVPTVGVYLATATPQPTPTACPCTVAPTVTSLVPTPVPATATLPPIVSECGVSLGKRVRVQAAQLEIIDPVAPGAVLVLSQDDIVVPTHGPLMHSNAVYWFFNAGGGVGGWGPEKVGGQCVVGP